jgi:uncharacterized protein YwgA
MLSMSFATALTVLGGLWLTVAKVQGAFDQLSVNTVAIQNIGMAMELRGIDREISTKQKEVRGLEVEILNNKGNTALINLLNQQIKTLNDEIEQQKLIRECVIDPTKKVCK